MSGKLDRASSGGKASKIITKKIKFGGSKKSQAS